MGCKANIAFRSPLSELAHYWRNHGAYPSFKVTRQANAFNAHEKKLFTATMAKVRDAIRQPIRYADNERTGKELFEAKDRAFFMPAYIWTELALLGRWGQESVVIRWAGANGQLSLAGSLRPLAAVRWVRHYGLRRDISAALKHQPVENSAGRILSLLLTVHRDERDTRIAADIYKQHLAAGGLDCVWTGSRLRPGDVVLLPFPDSEP